MNTINIIVPEENVELEIPQDVKIKEYQNSWKITNNEARDFTLLQNKIPIMPPKTLETIMINNLLMYLYPIIKEDISGGKEAAKPVTNNRKVLTKCFIYPDFEQRNVIDKTINVIGFVFPETPGRVLESYKENEDPILWSSAKRIEKKRLYPKMVGDNYIGVLSEYPHEDLNIPYETKGKFKYVLFPYDLQALVEEMFRLSVIYAKNTINPSIVSIPDKYEKTMPGSDNNFKFKGLDEEAITESRFIQNMGDKWRVYNLMEIEGKTNYVKEQLETIDYKNEMQKEKRDQDIEIKKYNLRYLVEDSFSYKLYKKEYDLLSTKEKDIVDAKIKKFTEIKEEDNKIQSIVDKFTRSFNARNYKEAVAESLKEVQDLKLKNPMHYNLCEHQIEKAKLIITNTSLKEIRETILDNWTDPNISDDYICKSCGRELYTYMVLDIIKFVDGEIYIGDSTGDTLEDDLYKVVASTVYTTIKAQEFVNLSALIKQIQRSIMPKVLETTKELERARIVNENYMNIFSAKSIIFTMALLANVVEANPHLKFTNQEASDRKSIVNAAFDFAAMLSSRYIRGSSSYINMSEIQPLFIATYKWVKQFKLETIKDTRSERRTKVADEIFNSSIYFYFYNVLNEFDENLRMVDVKKVLGRTFDEIDKELSHKSIFDTIPLIPKEKFLKKFTERQWNNYYAIWLFNTKSYKYTALPPSPEYLEYSNLLDVKQNRIDDLVYRQLESAPLLRVGTETVLYDGKRFKKANLALGYNQDGTRFKWDKYKYSNGKEYNLKEVIDNLKELTNVKLIDELHEKKSYNKIFESPTNNTKIENALIDLNTIKSFFDYYSIRCPLGTVHVYKNKQCTKCKITLQIEKNRDKSYYNKYEKYYFKSIDLYKNGILEIINDTMKVSQLKKEPPYKMGNWSDYNKFIDNIVFVTKADKNLLINLGLSNNRFLDDLKQRPIETNINDKRIKIDNIISYYSSLIVDYYKLKTHKSRYELPFYLYNLKIKMDYKKLPDILNKDFYSTIKQMRMDKNIDTLYKYVNYTFYETLNTIGANIEGKKIIGVFVNHILEVEETFCKIVPQVKGTTIELDAVKEGPIKKTNNMFEDQVEGYMNGGDETEEEDDFYE